MLKCVQKPHKHLSAYCLKYYSFLSKCREVKIKVQVKAVCLAVHFLRFCNANTFVQGLTHTKLYVSKLILDL